jgi:hypothetical protein
MERVFSSFVQGSNRYQFGGLFLIRKLFTAVAVVLALAPLAWAEEIRTTNPVVDFDSQSTVYGSATLTRKHDRISIELTASDLTPGVYTFWWGVTNPGEDLTAGWSGSRVVGRHGKTHFSADLSVGEILMLHPLSGGSLEDPFHADIIMVMRYHGPVDPDHINEQRHSFQPDTAVNALITVHNAP